MTKILLINPPTEDPSSRVTCPHMGLAYIASFLRSRHFDVYIIDAIIENLKLNDIRKRVIRIKPDIVGLTANTVQIESAALIARMIKDIDSDITTLVGGPHATTLPVETLTEFKSFDIACYGEGEITTYELIKKLENDENISSVKGIAYRIGDVVKLSEPRPFIKNLDSLPFPALDLFPLKKYKPYYDNKKNILELPLSSSRGCPHQCIFCYRTMGHLYRVRSVENIIDEINYNINRFSSFQIFFVDDTFTLNKERALELCNRLIKEKLNEKISWTCQTRVDSVDKELLQKMKEAGCSYISYGIESSSQRILNIIRKRITKEEIINATLWAKEAGIKVNLNFILGLPFETKKTILDTINLAIKLDPDFVVFSILVPFPGTEVLEMAKTGIGNLQIDGHEWKDYGKHMGNALSLKNLSREELEYLQLKAYMKFYMRPSKIKNIFKLINVPIATDYLAHNLKYLFKSGK